MFMLAELGKAILGTAAMCIVTYIIFYLKETFDK